MTSVAIEQEEAQQWTEGNSWWEYFDRNTKQHAFGVRLAVFKVFTRNRVASHLGLCVYTSSNPRLTPEAAERDAEKLRRLEDLTVESLRQLEAEGLVQRIDSPVGS